MTDLSSYSRDELLELKKTIDKEITQRRKDEEKQAREELKAVAEKYGFTLNELLEARGQTKTSSSGSPAKFRHPSDASKTWTGKGRKPAWLREWEANGGNKEDCRIG